MASKKVLIIAAHPDDEILGVGGTLCKHISNKDQVYVCIVTKAYEPEWSKEYIAGKIKEQNQVDKLLKIKQRIHMNFPTVKLNTYPHGEINKAVTKVVEKIEPDIVYTHFRYDLNLDHEIVFQAALVATRPPKNISLFCFETLSETEWATFPFQPNLWIEISKQSVEKKCEAFQMYKSEVKRYPHPRSPEGIEILAKKRGSEICVNYAEAFQVIRNIW